MHCGLLTLNAGRGLCLHCYRTPAIRQLYPIRKPGRKHTYGYCAGCQSDHRPLVGPSLCWHCSRTEYEDDLLTQTDPQREQRIALYADRAARRLPLFSD
ncbi:MAG: hypothetical protein L0Z62_45610 [Gemmataceae bacterium]|nr:hypothetical protein [Gemmataceae bacterium]